MQKRYLFALYSFILFFLLSGCGQDPHESKDIAQRKVYIVEKTVPTEKDEPPEEAKVVPSALSGLKAHFIDVGQGDATLFQFSDGGEDFIILIDAGNWTGDEVIQYLRSQKVSQIDIAVGTHPDADHIGQLDQVINTFNVGEVWLSGNTNPSQTFQSLLKAIDADCWQLY